MAQDTDILIPNFERELLRMAGADEQSPQLLARLDQDVRLAILFSPGNALVPAPGFFETDCGFEVIRRFSASFDRGQLALLGSGARPSDYTTRKLLHWAGEHQQLDLYGEVAESRMTVLNGGGWQVKRASTDAGLLTRWAGALESGTHPLLPVLRRSGASVARAEKAAMEMPASLEGTALLVDNIIRRMPPKASAVLRQRDVHELRVFLAHGFFDSYLQDATAIALVDRRLGGQATALPDTAKRVDARRLRVVLEGLRLDTTLLQEFGREELAELVDTATWQSMRVDLLRRAVASAPFNGDELLALRRVREPRTMSRGRRLDNVKLLLERQAYALAHADRRSVAPGRSRGPSPQQTRLFEQAGGLGVSGMHFHGSTNNFGPVINVEGGGRVELASAPVQQVLAATLSQVFTASNRSDAIELLRSLEAAVGHRQDITPEVVAEVVQEDLSQDVGRMPGPVRQALIDLGTGAGSGVIAEGVMLGIKALVGG